MAGPARLVSTDDGTLQLQGSVTFDNAAPLYRECLRLLVPGIRYLDCRGITGFDSSVLSLLLACRRLAVSHAMDLSINGMGDQLLSLARLYGVEKLVNGC